MAFENRILIGVALSGILFGSLGCMNAPKQAAVPSAATAPALLAGAQEQAPMSTATASSTVTSCCRFCRQLRRSTYG